MKKVVEILQGGGVGVLATDTIYGIVGSALKKSAVLRIYKLRKRNLKKPMIILIGSLDDLNLFGVRLDAKTKKLLSEFWPGKVSVILPCRSKKFSYLHRGTKTLAFRLPKLKWLRVVLEKTGPLVAPSANWEGAKPSRTVKEAKKYFGNKIDFYMSRGALNSKPSTLIKIEGNKVKLLRN
ncbi:threonylcarbamoyl-AMP synthase [Candidatus Nomurabacteria bacterium RIFCSPLOWO2_02_FULL_40_10]|uniref:L-threonylcarbamoyladenylate synthase n=1 Tax=Candidatus Nomurabacteria bacterium RIFCSPLOWO2_02_FULL_40_10 TaxID=1801786 RepID=A0A1F6XWW1_9BACT|nr:MAG: threonylcarbamoyl-AMP synthase [Candidatus Nomurabacteria bacterium RIFCSPLOWO2_02_FULL_40_10]